MDPMTSPAENSIRSAEAPLHIMHVVDTLERGGLERNVVDLARAQIGAGHRVAVTCLYRHGALSDELRSLDIEVYSAGKKDGRDPRPVIRLAAAIHRHRADVVHAHNLVPNYYSAAALKVLWRRPALVNTCHDMGQRLENARLQRFYRWSLKHTASVAMVADEVREHYVARGYVRADRSRVIHNGVPSRSSALDPVARLDASLRLGIVPDRFTVACVGRLVAVKNHALLIRALSSLRERQLDLQVVLVGGGELEAQLQALSSDLGIADRVFMVGEQSDVHSLLPAFDLFAQPSRSEGRSIALLEACIAGLPVVATRVGGNPGIVQNGVTGELIEDDDLDGLMGSIDRLMHDPARRLRLGTAARVWALANASIEAQERATSSFYRQALERPDGCASAVAC